MNNGKAIFVSALLSISANAQAWKIYTDPGEFAAAAAAAGLEAPSVVNFDELDASPLDNTVEGRSPFLGDHYATEGIVFSNPQGRELYIAPGGLFWNASNSLSVYRFPFDPFDPADQEEDNLEVALSGPSMAVGFTLVDNGTSNPNEFIQFRDDRGMLIAQAALPADFEPYRAFVGIVSTPDQPISVVSFYVQEAAGDGDDVNFDDFTFYSSGHVGMPFSSFSPRASLSFGPKTADDSFETTASLRLSKDSDGIDPRNENVTLKIGEFSATIPAGSFQTYRQNKVPDKVRYSGTIDGVSMTVDIYSQGHDRYLLWAKGSGVNFDGTLLPPKVGLAIGDDSGGVGMNAGSGKFK